MESASRSHEKETRALWLTAGSHRPCDRAEGRGRLKGTPSAQGRGLQQAAFGVPLKTPAVPQREARARCPRGAHGSHPLGAGPLSTHPLSAETPPGPQEERGRSQNSPKTLISPERYKSSIDLCLEKLGIWYFSHPRYQRRPQSEFKRHREKVF